MNQIDYKHDVFMVDTAADHLKRLISLGADQDRIQQARDRLVRYRKLLEGRLDGAMPLERLEIWRSLVESEIA